MKNKMIAQVLRNYRKQNQLSVREVTQLLADKSLKVAEKTIYGWENGQTQPNADTLLVLCEIYNIKDILGAFGYRNHEGFHITKHEQKLIMHYRQHPEFQKAVQKLLDFEENDSIDMN